MPGTAYPPPPPPARILDDWLRTLHARRADGLSVTWQPVASIWGRFAIEGEAMQLMLTTSLPSNPGPLTGVVHPLIGAYGNDYPDRCDVLIDQPTAALLMAATLDAEPSAMVTDASGKRWACTLGRAGGVYIVRLVAVS